MSLRFQNVVIRVTDIGLYKQYLLDPEATRSIVLVYRLLVLRHTNEELVAEKIVIANPCCSPKLQPSVKSIT